MLLRFNLLLLVVFNVQAGIFDNPENLKVLDGEISANDLGNKMKNFSMGLGVRCTHCHVGEEGQPLSTFDFASDDKENKKTARLMLKMVNKMNRSYVSKIENHSIKVECMTCHRGQSTPLLTQKMLTNKFDNKGIEATLETYDKIRERYYGTHSHDFSESMLLTVAQEVAIKDVESAIQLINKNLQFFPNSQQSFFALGQTYESNKQIEKAIESYQKANAIKPNPRLEMMIEKLKK